MRLWELVSSRTNASARCKKQSSAPVFEQLEPRLLLSADLSLGAALDPLPSGQDEPAILVNVQAESTLSVTNTNDAGVGSLRQAILDANANPGLDTIRFAIGSGPLTIRLSSALPWVSNPLTIDGTSQPGITIDATNPGNITVLTIAADGCVVQGLAISNAQGTPIHLLNANGCTLSNLDLSWSGTGRSGRGVYLGNSSGNTIEGVVARNRVWGFDLDYHSDNNVIRRCDASGNQGNWGGVAIGHNQPGAACDGNTVEDSTAIMGRFGIAVTGSGNRILRNDLSGCGTGVSVGGSSGTSILDNDLSDCTEWGLVINGDSQFTIGGNNFDGSRNGLALVMVDGVSLSPLSVDLRGVRETALSLDHVTDSTVADLDLSWSGPDVSGVGLYLHTSSDNRIEGVRVTNRVWGFNLDYHSDNNIIRRCEASGNGGYWGVAIGWDRFWSCSAPCDGNTVEDGTFTGFTRNQWAGGIGVTGNGNRILRNDASGCVTGVSVGAGSSGTSILNNDLSDSTGWGLVITGDSEFELRGNNFTGSANGLRLENVTGSTVADLDLSWSGTGRSGIGVSLRSSSGNRIEGVNVTNRTYGFTLGWSDQNTIRRCDGSNAGVGVQIGYDYFGYRPGANEGNTIEDNTFRGSGAGIDLVAGVNTIIRGNDCSGGGTGMLVGSPSYYRYGARVIGTQVFGNNMSNSGDLGLHIYGDSQVAMGGNSCYGSRNGLALGMVDGVSLSSSSVDLREISGIALKLDHVTNSTLRDFDLTWAGPDQSGIAVFLGGFQGTGKSNTTGNTIENVTVRNRRCGIDLSGDVHNNVIRNCTVSASGSGVVIGYDLLWGGPWGPCEGNRVEGCTLTGCTDTGIFLEGTVDAVLDSNDVSGCRIGIYGDWWSPRSGTKLLNNQARNSREWGIFFYGDSHLEMLGNDVSGSANGVYLSSVEGVMLSPSNVALADVPGTVLSLRHVTNSTVRDYDLSWSGPDQSGIGVFLGGFNAKASGNTVENVTVRNRRCGIDLSGDADNNVIRNCTVSASGSGVVIGYDLIWGGATGPSCEGNQVVGCTLAGCTGAGISLESTIDTVIEGNDVSGCATGIIYGGWSMGPTGTNIQGNAIHSNVGSGVIITWGTGNRIQGNSIYANGGLGIDLRGYGVTLNDPGDADTGPNNYQNFPVLASVLGGYTTRVQGSLNSVPNITFTVDFYASRVRDTSGYGEGERYLGSGTVTTNESGNVVFDKELAARTRSGEFITATATDPQGNTSEFSIAIVVPNVPPTLDDATFEIEENSPNGTLVGTVVGSDADGDTLTYTTIGGSGATAFAIEADTGQITVADETQFDYEMRPSFTLEIEVKDEHDATARASMTINLLNQASVTGVVFIDVDGDGVYEANEPGIDGVTIALQDEHGTPILNAQGSPVTAMTSSGGFYLFEDLRPGIYRLHEVQPTGVDDGGEILGSLGGTIPANDTMQLTLARTDASDYVFAELGQEVAGGDTASIGFWQNKHGQELIRRGGTDLADWLTVNFGHVFGDVFVGANGDDVARFFKDQLFQQKAEKSAGPAKVDAQYMAVALATYFTSRNLAGNVASEFGFHVTDTGTGTRIVNVGDRGLAFGVANGTHLTVMQLLLATNGLTDQPGNLRGYASIYDGNGDGRMDKSEAALRAQANEVYCAINEKGDK